MNRIFKLSVMFTMLTVLGSCEKHGPVPTVSTSTIINITKNSCTTGGEIISDGGYPISSKGICWSTNPSPTIADAKTSDGIGLGSFHSNATGMLGNKIYYVRAYATNSNGTGYGEERTFRTLNCKICQIMSFVNGVRESNVQSGNEYCETELVRLLAMLETRINNVTYKWECYD